MKKFGLFLLLIFSLQLNAQTAQEELEKEIENLGQTFNSFLGELQAAFEQGKTQLDTMDFRKLDEEGNMSLAGDTVNVAWLFNQIPSLLEKLPEGYRPDDQILEQQKELGKQIPDLLMESMNFLKAFEWEDLEQMIKELPVAPPGENPTSPSKQKKKTYSM